jgi:hypothetical protein
MMVAVRSDVPAGTFLGLVGPGWKALDPTPSLRSGWDDEVNVLRSGWDDGVWALRERWDDGEADSRGIQVVSAGSAFVAGRSTAT